MRKTRPAKYATLCAACNENFGSTSAFDAHRVGSHEHACSAQHPDGRRCLDPDEMRAKGMHKDKFGRWRRDGQRPNPHVTGVAPQPSLWSASRA